jgi:hypothetical protein
MTLSIVQLSLKSISFVPYFTLDALKQLVRNSYDFFPLFY